MGILMATGGPRDQTPAPDHTFSGYHQFRNPEGEPYGSFEVFHLDVTEGWYWHACYPGCLPDGEPNGPFPTAEGAYLDAIGD